MVREIRVHDDHEVSRGELEPVDVGGAEAEFPRAWLQDDAGGRVEFLQGLRDGEGAVGGGVVDDDEFPGEVAVVGW